VVEVVKSPEPIALLLDGTRGPPGQELRPRDSSRSLRLLLAALALHEAKLLPELEAFFGELRRGWGPGRFRD